jgi:hypothetical protein
MAYFWLPRCARITHVRYRRLLGGRNPEGECEMRARGLGQLELELELAEDEDEDEDGQDRRHKRSSGYNVLQVGLHCDV